MFFTGVNWISRTVPKVVWTGRDLTHDGIYGGVSVYSTRQTDNNINLINDVIEKSVLFTLNDIYFNMQISNVQEARSILNIIKLVFHDDQDEDSSDENDEEVLERFGEMVL